MKNEKAKNAYTTNVAEFDVVMQVSGFSVSPVLWGFIF